MGTRHLILVRYKGKWFLAQYGQWDGYPEGQGATIFEFLTNTDAEPFKRLELAEDSEKAKSGCSQSSTDEPTKPKDNIAALKTALDNDILYEPTQDDWDEILDKTGKILEEAQELKSAWEQQHEQAEKSKEYMERRRFLLDATCKPLLFVEPSLARDIGADILSYVAYSTQKVPIQKDVEFIMDWLFCEWAYVVDLDEHLLEVHSGCIPKEGCTGQDDGRFENEDFIKSGERGEHRPRLLVKLKFGELEQLSETAFVALCLLAAEDDDKHEDEEEDEEDEDEEEEEDEKDEKQTHKEDIEDIVHQVEQLEIHGSDGLGGEAREGNSRE